MRVTEMKAGQFQSLLHIKRQGDRGSGLFLLLCSSCIPNPRRHCDRVLTYCPCAQSVKKGRQGGESGAPGASKECSPPSQMRQRLPRSPGRKQGSVLRSELDPACARLSLAGSRPCGFGKVSPDVSSGSSDRLGLWPGFSGTSYLMSPSPTGRERRQRDRKSETLVTGDQCHDSRWLKNTHKMLGASEC